MNDMRKQIVDILRDLDMGPAHLVPDYEEVVNDILKAMREPTPAMIEAWSAPSNLTEYTDENCARADWQAMIDAALKGE